MQSYKVTTVLQGESVEYNLLPIMNKILDILPSRIDELEEKDCITISWDALVDECTYQLLESTGLIESAEEMLIGRFGMSGWKVETENRESSPASHPGQSRTLLFTV